MNNTANAGTPFRDSYVKSSNVKSKLKVRQTSLVRLVVASDHIRWKYITGSKLSRLSGISVSQCFFLGLLLSICEGAGSFRADSVGSG